MRASIIPIALLSTLCIGDYQSQTTWAGGPGVYGPEQGFSDTFSSCALVDWSSSPGVLTPVYGPFRVDESCFTSNLHFGDIDGDGDIDLAGTCYESGSVFWWENLEYSGLCWQKHVISSTFDGAASVWTVDLDLDGNLDVVAGAGWAGHEIRWWRNEDGFGTEWSENVLDQWNDGTTQLRSGDIDGDGDTDISATARLAGYVVWYENINEVGTIWQEHIIREDLSLPNGLDVYDVDQDNDLDVCCAVNGSSDLLIWFNLGGCGQVWTEQIVDGNLDAALYVKAADVDGDGDIDLAGAAEGSDEVSWYENLDGAGTLWMKHLVDTPIYGANSAWPADLDADGDLDIASTGYWHDRVIWYENNDGSGSSWTSHLLLDDYNGATSAFAADLDSDGCADVVAGSRLGDGVAWWNTGATELVGHLESTVLDTGVDPFWEYLMWGADEPTGTDVSFQVRASDNYADMGPWSGQIEYPGSISGVLQNGDRYFQYRAILWTEDLSVVPELHEVTVSWNPGSADEWSGAQSYVRILRNPAPGQATLLLHLSEPVEVQTSVFDASGRLIFSVPTSAREAGDHLIQLAASDQGVYFAKISAGCDDLELRFVVLD